MMCAYTRFQHNFPQSSGSGSTRPCIELEKMAINTIIVDDEKPARDELAFLLKAFPEINLIGQGKNAVDYVLKPFDKARIAKAITRARKMLDTQTSATERLEQLVTQLGAGKLNSSPPVKVLVKSQQRLLLVNGEDLVFATIA